MDCQGWWLFQNAFFAFGFGDDYGGAAVAEDVDGGAEHVEDAVDDQDDADADGDLFSLESRGTEDDDDGDEAGGGDTGDADGGQEGHEYDLELGGKGHLNAKELGQEDDDDAFVEGGAVHVDGGSEGQGEA